MVKVVLIKEAMGKGHMDKLAMGKAVMDKLIMEIILGGIHNLLITTGDSQIMQIMVGKILKIIMHGAQQVMEVGEEEAITNGEFIVFYSFIIF
jgi:hypothetical protein